jgi:hypothetical protein
MVEQFKMMLEDYKSSQWNHGCYSTRMPDPKKMKNQNWIAHHRRFPPLLLINGTNRLLSRW